MIGLHASVNWNSGRMKVNLVVNGRAEHPLEHLYTECIREGLRQALAVAHAKEQEMEQKAKETNIKIELAPLAAAQGPIGDEAIEIPFELPAPAPVAAVDRPPLFSELIFAVVEDLHKAGQHAAADLVTERAQAFMQRLAAWHQARAAGNAGGQQS